MLALAEVAGAAQIESRAQELPYVGHADKKRKKKIKEPKFRSMGKIWGVGEQEHARKECSKKNVWPWKIINHVRRQ